MDGVPTIPSDKGYFVQEIRGGLYWVTDKPVTHVIYSHDYEKVLVDKCYARLFPKWSAHLAGAETYSRDNCWAMLESLAVQFAVTRPQPVARGTSDANEKTNR